MHGASDECQEGHEFHFFQRIFFFVTRLCLNTVRTKDDDEPLNSKIEVNVTLYQCFSFSYLNSLWPLQIGGVENPQIKYPELNYTGFTGCIRKVSNNKHMYDLKEPLKIVNSAEGCTKARRCPNCNNNGYCEPYLKKASVCVCDVGFSGASCLTSKYAQ